MKLVLTCIFAYMTLAAIGQAKDTCSCTFTNFIQYPEKALKNKISGTVIIQLDSNEDGTLSNPVVIKGIGYGCDEEAIKSVKREIQSNNKCALSCKWHTSKGKVTRSFNFKFPEDYEE